MLEDSRWIFERESVIVEMLKGGSVKILEE